MGEHRGPVGIAAPSSIVIEPMDDYLAREERLRDDVFEGPVHPLQKQPDTDGTAGGGEGRGSNLPVAPQAFGEVLQSRHVEFFHPMGLGELLNTSRARRLVNRGADHKEGRRHEEPECPVWDGQTEVHRPVEEVYSLDRKHPPPTRPA